MSMMITMDIDRSMPKSDRERSAESAERKKKAGLKKISVSLWVEHNHLDDARRELRQVAGKYAAEWPR